MRSFSSHSGHEVLANQLLGKHRVAINIGKGLSRYCEGACRSTMPHLPRPRTKQGRAGLRPSALGFSGRLKNVPIPRKTPGHNVFERGASTGAWRYWIHVPVASSIAPREESGRQSRHTMALKERAECSKAGGGWKSPGLKSEIIFLASQFQP